MPTESDLSIETISKRVKEVGRGPFLFIGSGFSRRYLDCPTWTNLLAQFAITGKDFGYFLTKANGDLARAASLLAEEFHEKWWMSPEFEESRGTWKSMIKGVSDPLKIEIARYLHAMGVGKAEMMPAEKQALAKVVVDGVITTNWDCFLESVFPDFKVFKGQDSLLFSNPVSVAEIYKIHGCCTDPTSLVLTQEDYKQFRERNAYLAAKLVNVFLEHPVFFFGYSLSDNHIVEILDSVMHCLGRDHIGKLQDRLFFVNWSPSAASLVLRRSFFKVGEITLPITTIDTDTFTPIFEQLSLTQRKIPARILRYCKEQLYELIQQNDPTGRLCVLPLECEHDFSKVDFVVGVGASQALTGARGYSAFTRAEILEDVLFDNGTFDARSLLSKTIPTLLKASRYVPVFKYLARLGIKTLEAYKASGFRLDDAVLPVVSPKKHDNYKKHAAKLGVRDLQSIDKDHAMLYCQHLNPALIVAEELGDFLRTNFPGRGHRVETAFGKAVCIYDRIRYGWPE